MDFDIKKYCDDCKLKKVRPFHNTCYHKCKYSEPSNENLDRNYRYYDLKKGEWSVYFIKCREYVKIGKTKDIDNRLELMHWNNPFDLNIMLFLDHTGDKCEGSLHKHFSEERYKREWFYFEGRIERFVNLSFPKIRHTLNKISYDVYFDDVEIMESESIYDDL